MRLDIKYWWYRIDNIDVCDDIINNLCVNARYAYQWVARGWSDKQLWNLDITICKFVLPRIKEFRKDVISYPSDITYEKWLAILDEMIYALDVYVNALWDIKYNSKEWKRYENGMKLFHKYFDHLWS